MQKGNPFAQVQQLTVFEKLKKAVNEGYFEELIRKYLLENPHGCIMTLIPKKGLAAQREKGAGGEAGSIQKQSF